jgi:hypothetical protein
MRDLYIDVALLSETYLKDNLTLYNNNNNNNCFRLEDSQEEKAELLVETENVFHRTIEK